MGRLYLPAQFFDGNGDPLAGGKVYTFDAAATTTPKATYTTNALSVAHANPIVLDGEGRFPDAFAATGEGFFIELTDASDDPVAEFENVEALGESSTDNITRTFTASRYKVSSGEVESGNDGTLVEFGSSAPVNTGGYVKESGWAETQGTKKIVDFADVELTGDMTIAGSLAVSGTGATSVGGSLNTGSLITENSKKLPGVIYTNATPFSAVASVEIPLPNSPTGVLAWDIEIIDFQRSSATGTLDLTLSFDNASSYKTGAGDYLWGYGYLGASQAWTVAQDDSDTKIVLLPGTSTATAKLGRWRFRVHTVASGTNPTTVRGDWEGQILFSGAYYGSFATSYGVYVGAASQRATHMKIAPASGTISGAYRIMPLRGFGE